MKTFAVDDDVAWIDIEASYILCAKYMFVHVGIPASYMYMYAHACTHVHVHVLV